MSSDRAGRETRKAVSEMVAEFLREAAVLIAVFLPMDIVLVQEEAFTIVHVVVTMLIVGGLLTIGIVIERTRRVS